QIEQICRIVGSFFLHIQNKDDSLCSQIVHNKFVEFSKYVVFCAQSFRLQMKFHQYQISSSA
ncbi:unnamed protein product, partial [Brugia timori]|uniref:RB_B domain-containing protein n=1 Tax=Brugia timori TaxID=42155 RepID=A0A0R3QYJ2_9BILA